ncbi:MAG: response regulator [Proteobacteria bacterium]|nr:response regulator [Pseudomonadota bacterium]
MDDDPLLLNSICRRLEGIGVYSVDRASNARQAITLARNNPDLALVDVGLGRGEPSGIDLVRDLRDEGYRGHVCMLTGDDDAGTMLRALIAGADDYLLKLRCRLPDDVEAMLERRVGRPPRAALDPEAHGRFLRSAGLTSDQICVLCAYAALGFPENKALADQLEMTVAATSKTITRAEEKLGLENRAQFVRLLTVLSGFGLRERPGAG